MTAEERHERKNIITRLAIATRERVEAATLTVYLEETAGCQIDVLREVCRRLARTSAWFPKVAEIVEACVAEQRLLKERAETRKMLTAGAPVSEERQKELLHSLAELVKKRDWR